MLVAQLSLLLIWNLQGYLNSYCLKPIAAPSRRYSSEDTKFIKSEVQRLLDADIIEPSRSPWRAQVLVVKQGEKKRLVIDYSVTIQDEWFVKYFAVQQNKRALYFICRNNIACLKELISSGTTIPGIQNNTREF